MAPSYTPQNAIDLVKKYCRDVVVTSIDSQLCDIIHSTIWTYYPWKWSQSALTAIALVDGTQDYTIANNDVYRFLRLRIVRTDTTPDDYGDPLEIRNSLEPDLNPRGYQSQKLIAFEPVSAKLRLESAAFVGTGETLQIQGEYQKQPTLINDAALVTAFVWPDIYFGPFVEGLKWKLYQFVDDKRAGTVLTDKTGRTTYSGQLGIFMSALDRLAAAEDYAAEDSTYPETPLGEAAWTY